jgi:hypothetical protein
MSNVLDKNYLEHRVFGQLTEYAEFYRSLSDTTMGFVSHGIYTITNIDTYVFTSIQGTLESIHDILYKGRINDSYALLRKYYDSIIINIYTNLYINDNFDIDNLIVEKIDNWVNGKEKIPSFGIMSEYIIKSPKVEEITKLIYKDSSFKGSSLESIRQRCNDHTHYLYYHNLLFNDNEIYLPKRVTYLDRFSNELRDIFILHLSYLFYINDHYMSSTDYADYLDCGMTPIEDSQYWVASFIQETFDNWIKKYRPDIAKTIIAKTSMKLE